MIKRWKLRVLGCGTGWNTWHLMCACLHWDSPALWPLCRSGETCQPLFPLPRSMVWPATQVQWRCKTALTVSCLGSWWTCASCWWHPYGGTQCVGRADDGGGNVCCFSMNLDWFCFLLLPRVSFLCWSCQYRPVRYLGECWTISRAGQFPGS